MNHNPCQIPLPPSPAPTTLSYDSMDSDFFIVKTLHIPQSFIMSTTVESNDSGNSIKVLESHNYHQWSDVMFSYFLEHNLDGIVDGPRLSQRLRAQRLGTGCFVKRKQPGSLPGNSTLAIEISSLMISLEEIPRHSGPPSKSSMPLRKPGINPNFLLDFSF